MKKTKQTRPSNIQYCRIIVRNTIKSTKQSIYKVIFSLNWLYIFSGLLTYYSLKLFLKNVWICYIILFLFLTTSVIFLFTNFKKLNQRNNQSVNFSSFKETNKIKLSKFAFLDSWQSELASLNRKSIECDKLIYPDSMLISSMVDQIVGLMITSFIKPWYKNVNQNLSNADDLFLDEIKISIKFAMTAIHHRLAALDFSDVIVLKLLPIFTDHFKNYVNAKALIRKKHFGTGDANDLLNSSRRSKFKKYADNKLNLTDNKQMNLLISQFYNHGKLHTSVNSFRENSQFSTISQKAHIRDRLNKILPLLLEKREIGCPPVKTLVREILINCVFLPVIGMVVDPDFWNQMIVERIGSTLKDRTKVIQLRAELQKHSKNATTKQKKSKGSRSANGTIPKKKMTDNTLFEFKLSLSTNQSVFEKFLKKINKSSSIVDLRTLKFYISLQLQKTMRNEDYKKVMKEVADSKKESKSDPKPSKEAVKASKDLTDSYERYKILIKRLQIVQLTLTNRINSLNFENQANNLDNVSIVSSQTGATGNGDSISGTKSDVNNTPAQIDLSLLTILNDPSLLTYYMEYMDQNQKLILLQFWLVVNGIKNPLEDPLLINADEIYDDSVISTSYQDAEINQNLNFSNDITSIFNNYFKNKLIIDNNKIVYENVETFVKANKEYRDYIEKYKKFEEAGKAASNHSEGQNGNSTQSKESAAFKIDDSDASSVKSGLEDANSQERFNTEKFNDYELFNRKYELNKLFLKARKSILVLQANAFKHMENDLDSFKNSNIYLKLLASENSRLYEIAKGDIDHGLGARTDSAPGTSGFALKEKNGDPLAGYNFDDDEDETRNKSTDDPLSNSISSMKPGSSTDKIFDDSKDLVVSYDVINAVEDALNEIIQNNNDYKSYDAVKLKSDILTGDLLGSTSEDNVEESTIKSSFKDIFGQSSSLFKSDFKDKDSAESKESDSKETTDKGSRDDSRSFLFNNEEEINEIDDMDSVISDMINSEAFGEYETGHLPTPGNLSLASEIEKLNNDIQNLNNQIQILEPLLQKAELTNNIAELRILRKANISLQREVQLKELQRQQYIVQENDNSLFGKSKVSIQSYIISTDEQTGKEYTSYIIEVQRINVNDETGEETTPSTWIVARRFSQFYMLNKYLRPIYPETKLLNFPKKNIMFLNQAQQKILVESRKSLLETYLKELLKNPAVCRSQIFRLFLSSQNFSNEIFTQSKYHEKSSDGDGLIHERHGEKYKAIEDVTAKLYNSITNGIEYLNGSIVFANSNAQNAGLTSGLKYEDDGTIKLNKKKVKNGDMSELQNELNSYDEDKTTFVKPICDLLLSIFALDRNNSWLRGRAILVVLQQLLGSTIERKIRDYVSIFKTENKVIDLLNLCKDKLWPDDVFFLTNRGSPTKRSESEKNSTRDESRTLLEIIITDISSKIVGMNNARFAAAEIHNMLQNDILNTHLIYTILDEVLDGVFPELADDHNSV